MIEEYLINYGVLGIWTLSLLYERAMTGKETKNVIRANTEALILIRAKFNKK